VMIEFIVAILLFAAIAYFANNAEARSLLHLINAHFFLLFFVLMNIYCVYLVLNIIMKGSWRLDKLDIDPYPFLLMAGFIYIKNIIIGE
jgi:hypothetical protein